MATDNVVANPAAGGAVFATDNKGGTENWPISKIGFGTRDTNYYIVDYTVPLPTQEAVSITETDASSTVGTSVVTAITAGTATKWVDIENGSLVSGNLLGYTFDGSTPGFTGGQPNAGTKVLLPGGTKTYSSRIPSAALKIIGSAAGTIATIKYA